MTKTSLLKISKFFKQSKKHFENDCRGPQVLEFYYQSKKTFLSNLQQSC